MSENDNKYNDNDYYNIDSDHNNDKLILSKKTLKSLENNDANKKKVNNDDYKEQEKNNKIIIGVFSVLIMIIICSSLYFVSVSQGASNIEESPDGARPTSTVTMTTDVEGHKNNEETITSELPTMTVPTLRITKEIIVPDIVSETIKIEENTTTLLSTTRITEEKADNNEEPSISNTVVNNWAKEVVGLTQEQSWGDTVNNENIDDYVNNINTVYLDDGDLVIIVWSDSVDTQRLSGFYIDSVNHNNNSDSNYWISQITSIVVQDVDGKVLSVAYL